MPIYLQKISAKIKDWHLVAAACLYSLILAIYYKEISGVDIEYSYNSWTVHLLPREDLEGNLLESILHLNTQAPGFNILAGIILKISSSNYYEIMHYFNIILGAISCGMTYFILFTITRNRLFAFVVSLVIISNPSIYLYEAMNLYELLTSYLIIQSVFFVSLYAQDKKSIYLILFVLTLNILSLTRGSFHLIIPLSGLIFSCLIVSRKDLLRVSLLSILLCLPTLGWYAKNHIMFGFFGTSSWFGANLFSAVIGGHQFQDTPGSKSYVDNLLANGIIHPMVGRHLNVMPRMADVRREGFNKTSTIEFMNKENIFNINFIDVYKIYLHSAINLIKYDPLQWLKTISSSYEKYCRPSTVYKYHIYGRTRSETGNAQKMALPVFIYENIFLGKGWMVSVDQKGGFKMGSILFFVFPLSFLLYLVLLLRDGNYSLYSVVSCINNNPTLLVIYAFVLYNTLVSCVLTYDENERYKFNIEQIFYTGFFGVCFLLLIGRTAHITRGLRA